jgi:hypothetical protein
MRTMSWAPLLSVTVVTSRFSRVGVHDPDVVSLGELSGGRGGDRGAEGRDGGADRGAGRRQPVVGRGASASLYQPAGVRLVDDDPGSTIGAATVSGTEVAVQCTGRRGLAPVVHALTVAGRFGWPVSKQRGCAARCRSR